MGSEESVLQQRMSCVTIKKRKKRGVTFHPSAKTWDGISSSTQHLERLVAEFWGNWSCVQVLKDLVAEEKLDELRTLYDELGHIIKNSHEVRRVNGHHYAVGVEAKI